MDIPRWKLSTETVLNLVQTVAIVVGIVFGLRELRELEKSRELASTLNLVGLYQNESTATGMARAAELPADLSLEEFNRLSPEERADLFALTGTWESLGILVHRGDVSLELADEFFGGLVLLSWDRLRPWAMQAREREGNPQILEWFQWLAERLQEHRTGAGAIPAYELHRDWQP